MTSDKPIKCARVGYKPEPFYWIEWNGDEKRYVVSFVHKENIKAFLFDFIDQGKEMDIMIRDVKTPEIPIQYEGETTNEKLKATIEQYDEFIFHDGFHELLISIPDIGDYIAFDDHGLIYIYTAADYSVLLEKHNLPVKTEMPFDENGAHWHYGPPDRDNELDSLVAALGLRTIK